MVVDDQEVKHRNNQLFAFYYYCTATTLWKVLSEDFGLFTWPSAIVLACLVWSRREEFRGASVVEIGAGTALPGLLAAKVGIINGGYFRTGCCGWSCGRTHVLCSMIF